MKLRNLARFQKYGSNYIWSWSMIYDLTSWTIDSYRVESNYWNPLLAESSTIVPSSIKLLSSYQTSAWPFWGIFIICPKNYFKMFDCWSVNKQLYEDMIWTTRKVIMGWKLKKKRKKNRGTHMGSQRVKKFETSKLSLPPCHQCHANQATFHRLQYLHFCLQEKWARNLITTVEKAYLWRQ